jgi:hypothetical protein
VFRRDGTFRNDKKWLYNNKALDIVDQFCYSVVLFHYNCKCLTTQKRCPVYQLLAHGRWFSPGNPASSTTKTGRHDKAEILLKVVLNTNNQ